MGPNSLEFGRIRAMAPAQALLGKETKTAVKANGDLMRANSCEGNAFYVESLCGTRRADDGGEDEEVEILECNGAIVTESVKDDDPDATEHSSSFGDSFSDSGSPRGMEADSGFAVENGDPLPLDGSNRVFKKKRVTHHWRKFIHPIMWRCQWLELRMKELHSQTLKYDKELKAYKYEKHLQSKVVRLDNSASRSVPLACRSHKNQAMRRRKRKRNEDTVDISSYMSKHSIFSYYENKRPEKDVQSVDVDCDDQVNENINEDLEWSVLRYRRSDSSLVQILLDIESALSRVLKLRSQLDKVICRNAMEISTPGNPFPGYSSNICAQSPSFSPGNDGDGMQVDALNAPIRHMSECQIEDTFMPGTAISSNGGTAELDMLESMMGMFSATNIPLDQHDIAELCKDKDADDDVFIDNQTAEEGLQNFKKVGHAIKKPQAMPKEEAGFFEKATTIPKVSIPEPCLGRERADMQQQPVLKPCYTGKKRGRPPKKRHRGDAAGGPGGVKNKRVQKQRFW